MRLSAFALLCLAANGAAAPAFAQIDDIPPPQETADTVLAAHIYFQSDLTLTSLRSNLIVPLPPPAPPQWEARMILDARVTWEIDPELSFAYSGRLNLRGQDGIAFPSHADIRNDLREAYFTWQEENVFVELGRINLKSGVAEGFNPTDYFKTRAVVDTSSADPSVLREDRLGAVMLVGQAVWPGGALTFAMAPKLAHDSAPYLDSNLPDFNPMLDRTNARTRLLIKGSFHLLDDVSPEVLAFDDDGHTSFGLNVTKGFGQSVIGYLEWSGGRRASLEENAFTNGFSNGVLPPMAPVPTSTARGFMKNLALGASYATRIGINIDFEYDYHQAGFSSADWRNWFDNGANAQAAGALWYVRGYAGDQQEPMARNSIFQRADWQNAFIRDLTLTGILDTDLHDGSGFAQFTAEYYLSATWTIGGLVDIYYGKPRSNFGSLPQKARYLVEARRYF